MVPIKLFYAHAHEYESYILCRAVCVHKVILVSTDKCSSPLKVRKMRILHI